MKWLNDEVFVQSNNEEMKEMDEEQCEFEDGLAQAIAVASAARRREREEAARLLNGGSDGEEEH